MRSSQLKPSYELLTPKQQVALQMMAGPQRHTMLYGGSRSGKTVLFVRSLIIRALRYPGSRHAIFRHRLNAVRATIGAQTIPFVLQKFFPGITLPGEDAVGRRIFSNGSEMWLCGLDDKERVEKILGGEYCVDPNAKILTSNLEWVAAKDIAAGQELIAFPESLDGHCTLEPSQVLSAETIQAERVRIVTDKGDTIVSAGHGFVAHHDDRRARNFRQFSWVKAIQLSAGDRIRWACEPWHVGTSWDDGWMAGMIDGEGWVTGSRVGVAQNPGLCLSKMQQWFERNNIPYRLHGMKRTPSGGAAAQLIARGMWASLRMLGITRPYRLLAKSRAMWSGTRAFMQRPKQSHEATVLRVELLGRGPVVAFQTSTKTLIADGFLGHNCSLYFNECSQIPWNSAELALSRLAQNIPGMTQRAYYDLNPAGNRHWTYRQFMEKRRAESNATLPDPENYKWMQVNPEDNRANLTEEYLLSLQRASSKAVARFWKGEFVPEIEGALWTIEAIERQRIDFEEMPHLHRIVVAVDPSGAKGPDDKRSNAIGIVAMGKAQPPDKRSFVLRDVTMTGSPAQWAKVACDLYDELGADAIVAEQNYGGEMVRHTIKTANPHANVRMVVASRGKHIRAEPVSAEYEAGNVFHVRAPLDAGGGHRERLRWGQNSEGRFDELEEELCNMATHGYQGPTSPNRLDALVWAGNDLFGKPVVSSDAVVEIAQPSFGRSALQGGRLS